MKDILSEKINIYGKELQNRILFQPMEVVTGQPTGMQIH